MSTTEAQQTEELARTNTNTYTHAQHHTTAHTRIITTYTDADVLQAGEEVREATPTLTVSTHHTKARLSTNTHTDHHDLDRRRWGPEGRSHTQTGTLTVNTYHTK